jgi:hypothetical protein
MRAAATIMSERRRLGPKIALPDAIIQATANIKNLTIITRNTKDFKGVRVRIPYELKTTSFVSVVNVDPPGKTPTSKAASRRKLTRIR